MVFTLEAAEQRHDSARPGTCQKLDPRRLVDFRPRFGSAAPALLDNPAHIISRAAAGVAAAADRGVSEKANPPKPSASGPQWRDPEGYSACPVLLCCCSSGIDTRSRRRTRPRAADLCAGPDDCTVARHRRPAGAVLIGAAVAIWCDSKLSGDPGFAVGVRSWVRPLPWSAGVVREPVLGRTRPQPDEVRKNLEHITR